MIKEKTIAVDFDGVIHAYSNGWQTGEIYDEPVVGAMDAMNRLQKKGYKVVIFTARDLEDGKVSAWITRRWNQETPCPEITNRKPMAIAYIDDRAIRFTNWRDMMNYF